MPQLKNTAAPKNGMINGSAETSDIPFLRTYIKMPVDIKKAIDARRRLIKEAAKEFTFRGTRKIREGKGYFKESPASKDALPAGRKPRPFKELLRAAEENVYNEENEYDESGRLLARFFPEPAAKITDDKDIKAMKLREELFVPVSLKGIKGWLDRQDAYIDALPQRDIEIMRSYTSHGDRLVNAYCRGALGNVTELVRAMVTDTSVPLAHSFYDQFHLFQRKFPKDEIRTKDYYKLDDGNIDMAKIGTFFNSHLDFFGKGVNLETMLEQYKQDLMRIIEGSPRLTSDIIVYRGIESEKHVASSEYKNKDFLSTTLDPFSVLEFTEDFENESKETHAKFYCCVYEIALHKSVPCMYMQFFSEYSNEFEVLVPPGMNVKLGKTVKIKIKPSRRNIKRGKLLEPYFTENILVVDAEVRRPSPRAKKTLKLIHKKR